MPKAIDIAYVVYQVPDLDRMQEFLEDFGMLTAARSAEQLCMRGAGSAPVIHVTRRGDGASFLGGALQMESRQDLEALAKFPGSSAVELIDDLPGGGWRVRMITPDGVCIDGIWGQQLAQPHALRDPHAFNAASEKRRINLSVRPKREPGLVSRLGHFVLRTSNHARTKAWFQERFDLIDTDYLCVPSDESRVIGTFVRFNRGTQPVDHHSMLIVQSEAPGVHHCSFEMQDLDMVFGAHDYLLEKGYVLECGVGRHLVGSQIFDYWRDPFNFRVEHYTDGDMADNNYEPNRYAVAADDTTQWGPQPPKAFFD